MGAYFVLIVAGIIGSGIALITYYRYLKTKYPETVGEYPQKLRSGLNMIANKTDDNGLIFAAKRFASTHGRTITELAILAFWALWIGRDYLGLDPAMVPAGREYGSVVQSHHIWTQFKECGYCAIWDGGQRGGFPAFANIYAGVLHPITILATLIWGVVNGSKVMVLASLWLAGVAQWLLARKLKLGWLPRIWSGMLVMVGGHLAGRIQLGLVSMVLATAMVSFIYVAVLALAESNTRRGAVLLGAATASAILAGQGYLQFGAALTLPAFGFLLLDKNFNLRPVVRNFVLAGFIAMLLAAPLLVPLAHLGGNFVKISDPDFQVAQPLAYAPLNLVINDTDYYEIEVLSHQPLPSIYILFIGWIPVILAIMGMSFGRMKDKNISFLGVSAILIFLFVSPTGLSWLNTLLRFIGIFRFPGYILGAAIPPIVGAAAYGLDKLLNLDWPNFQFGFSRSPSQTSNPGRNLSLRWVLLIPVIFSINQAYNFSEPYYYTVQRDENVPSMLAALETPDLQWVQPPFGEHFWIQPAMEMNLKLSPGIIPWQLKDRQTPGPYLEAIRSNQPTTPDAQLVDTILGVNYFVAESNRYATIVAGDQTVPCFAQGSGGSIEVSCDSPVGGTLVVRENVLPGWKAWVDDVETSLSGDNWLELDAPPGTHTYKFRYLPWNVPLGLALFVIGVGLSVWLWFKPKSETDDPKEQSVEANP